MWLPIVMRVVICMGLSLFLGSCTQSLWCNGPKPYRPPGLSTAGIESSSMPATVDLVNLKKRLASYESDLFDGTEVQSASLAEAARLCFIIGQLGNREESEGYFEKGRSYAEILCRREPSGVAGHYWFAMNTAGLAGVGGAGRALRLIPDIVDELKAAAAIDGSYDQGGPHRVLGRIYCEAPCWPLSEGNMEESLRHLLLAVQLAPDNITNHLYLAQTLLKLGRFEEADRELEEALRCTSHSLSIRCLEEDRQQALHLKMRPSAILP